MDKLQMLPYVYFNETAFQFIDDISSIYPADNRIKVAKNVLVMYTAKKKTSLQEAFMLFIEPHRERVATKDDDFFLTTTYNGVVDDELHEDIEYLKTDYLKKTNETDGSTFGFMLEGIKSHWKTMDAHNRTMVWKYMEQLLKLSDVCVLRQTRAR